MEEGVKADDLLRGQRLKLFTQPICRQFRILTATLFGLSDERPEAVFVDVGDGGLVRWGLDQPHLPFRFHSESIALPEADFQITSWNSLLSHAHYIAPGIPVLALTKGL